MHEPIPQQGRWLSQVIRGYFAYHAVPTNYPRLGAFRDHVLDLWRRTLRRRSQKDWTTWCRVASRNFVTGCFINEVTDRSLATAGAFVEPRPVETLFVAKHLFDRKALSVTSLLRQPQEWVTIQVRQCDCDLYVRR